MADSSRSTAVLQTPIEPSKLRSGSGEKKRACLVLLHPGDLNMPRRIALLSDEYSIGREPGVDLIVARESVSRVHARMSSDDQGNWTLTDLQSTNGTFINDDPIAEQPLEDGDQIRFGDAVFKFLSGENLEADYHEQIYRMTIIDGLTGVHNVRYFREFLEREISSARRYDHSLSLSLFDIDFFKVVNDERGHLAGDAVLKQLAMRLKPRIRREDLLARYGGEEFACVLRETSLRGAVTFGEDLRRMVAGAPFRHDGESFQVTVSVGVAELRPSDKTSDELIGRADAELYRAKRMGRNRVSPSPSGLSKID